MREADAISPSTGDQSAGSAGSEHFTLPQFGIFAQGTHAHHFLEFDLKQGVTPATRWLRSGGCGRLTCRLEGSISSSPLEARPGVVWHR